MNYISIKKSSEFSQLKQARNALKSRFFVIQNRETPNNLLNEEHKIRVGLTVSKKIGKAVARNKMKRRIRAIISDYAKSDNLKDYDLVILPRMMAIGTDFNILKKDIFKLLEKIKK